MCMAAGHTASWGKGYPELLTDCYDAQERPTGLKGPINPARNETYALLWQLLREAATAFPDSYSTWAATRFPSTAGRCCRLPLSSWPMHGFV